MFSYTSSSTGAIALAQIGVDQCWADPADGLERNKSKVLPWYDEVADEVDLMVFPELALTGYIPLKGYDQRRKRLLYEIALRCREEVLPELARATRDRRASLVVGLMKPAQMRYEMFNALVLAEDGEVAAVHRKIHLPVEENHYFVPGNDVTVVSTKHGRIALLICYDMLFPESVRIAALRGAALYQLELAQDRRPRAPRRGAPRRACARGADARRVRQRGRRAADPRRVMEAVRQEPGPERARLWSRAWPERTSSGRWGSSRRSVAGAGHERGGTTPAAGETAGHAPAPTPNAIGPAPACSRLGEPSSSRRATSRPRSERSPGVAMWPSAASTTTSRTRSGSSCSCSRS